MAGTRHFFILFMKGNTWYECVKVQAEVHKKKMHDCTFILLFCQWHVYTLLAKPISLYRMLYRCGRSCAPVWALFVRMKWIELDINRKFHRLTPTDVMAWYEVQSCHHETCFVEYVRSFAHTRPAWNAIKYKTEIFATHQFLLDGDSTLCLAWTLIFAIFSPV